MGVYLTDSTLQPLAPPLPTLCKQIKNKNTPEPKVQDLITVLALKKIEEQSTQKSQALAEPSSKILGKSYFKNPEVNKGYYSKKREGVADVDPKVSSHFQILGYGTICPHPWKSSKEGGH